MVAYLSRYTHRVAISNSRLIAFNETSAIFKWKHYRVAGVERAKVIRHRGVHPSLPHPRPARRIPPHPPLRTVRQWGPGSVARQYADRADPFPVPPFRFLCSGQNNSLTAITALVTNAFLGQQPLEISENVRYRRNPFRRFCNHDVTCPLDNPPRPWPSWSRTTYPSTAAVPRTKELEDKAMAGISIMAPFVATVMAAALPNPQANSTGVPCRPSNLISGARSNQGYLASGGATAPRPYCDSQAPTLERSIHDRSDHLENKICSNC